jgi:hypothetical protein
MLYFGRVDSSWGHRAFFGSSWGENVITPYFYILCFYFGRIKFISFRSLVDNMLDC